MDNRITKPAYLTESWAVAFTAALNASDEFSDVAKRSAVLQFDVQGAPGGDATYYVAIADGTASVGLGAPPTGPDLVFTSSYGTAVEVARGSITGREAYAAKRMTANAGPLTLMKYAGLFGAVGAVQAELDVEFAPPV